MGNDINILTQECSKEKGVYTVCMNFENSYSSNNCTLVFSEIKKNIPGYIITPLIKSFNKEAAYIEELTQALRFEDITSSYFLNKYPYLSSLLIATQIKRYDIPFLTSYKGTLSIVNPIHCFNAKRAIQNNDFSSFAILNAVNKSFEICEYSNQEYGNLIKQYIDGCQSTVKKHQKKRDDEWFKGAAIIALKMGCKLLVSAAAGMIGANIDFDISLEENDLRESQDFDINSLTNNIDCCESFYGNYDAQDLSYIYDIPEIDQNLTIYNESNISFESKATDKNWAEYYLDKADKAYEQEQWHYDRAAQASENGDEAAAKDHIARAKSWHKDAEKFLRSAKLYK